MVAYGGISAGIAAGGLLGGMMIAGGALTAIGAVTGDKDVSRFGSILSLAGGVGALANGAADQAATQLAEQARDEGMKAAGEQAAGQVGEQAAAAGANSAASLAGDQAANLAGDQVGSLAGAAGSTGTPTAGELSGLGADAASDLATANPLKPLLGDSAASAPASGASTSGFGGAGADPSVASPGSLAPPAEASWTDKAAYYGNKVTDGIGDALSGATRWAHANPELTKVAGGLVAGAMNNYGQQDAIRTRLQLEEDALARRRQAYTNSVNGIQVKPIFNTTKTSGTR